MRSRLTDDKICDPLSADDEVAMGSADATARVHLLDANDKHHLIRAYLLIYGVCDRRVFKADWKIIMTHLKENGQASYGVTKKSISSVKQYMAMWKGFRFPSSQSHPADSD